MCKRLEEREAHMWGKGRMPWGLCQ
jgi:hypothetical protein